MSELIKKSHNANLILFHLVCPAKRRKKVFLPEVEEELKVVCKWIGECYEMIFVEIGSDEDHVHFLIQTVPPRSATSLVKTVKSITAKKTIGKISMDKGRDIG